MNLQGCVERAIQRLSVEGVKYHNGKPKVFTPSTPLRESFNGAASFVSTSPLEGKIIPKGDRKIVWLGKEKYMEGSVYQLYVVTGSSGEDPVFFIFDGDDHEPVVRLITPEEVPEYMLAKLGG